MSYSIDRGEKGYRVRSKRAKVGEEVFDGGFVPVPAFYSASYLIHSFIYSFQWFHSFIYFIHLSILFVAVHVEGRKVLFRCSSFSLSALLALSGAHIRSKTADAAARPSMADATARPSSWPVDKALEVVAASLTWATPGCWRSSYWIAHWACHAVWTIPPGWRSTT